MREVSVWELMATATLRSNGVEVRCELFHFKSIMLHNNYLQYQQMGNIKLPENV